MDKSIGYRGGITRREAAPEEARALANPLRLRILRLCLDEALTNKQIADRLGHNAGTTLHHVRMLTETGFLAVAEERPGPRGSREKPYRATGKSWEVSVEDNATAHAAMADAFREELVAAGPDSVLLLTRFANRLNDEGAAELFGRLKTLVEEFALRDDPDGRRMAFFIGGHLRGG